MKEETKKAVAKKLRAEIDEKARRHMLDLLIYGEAKTKVGRAEYEEWLEMLKAEGFTIENLGPV